MSITIRQATPDDATAIYDMIYAAVQGLRPDPHRRRLRLP